MSPEPSQRGVTEVFSRMASLAFSTRGLRFFPWLIGVYLLAYAVMGLAAAMTAYAALGTLRFHRIVNTGCFVKSGSSDTVLRPHCDWFPLPVNWVAFAVGVAISIVVVALVWAASYICVVRLADRLGEGSARRVVPTLPEVARAVGRVIGWSIVVYVGALVAFAVVIAAFAVCAAVLPTALAVLLGIALAVGAIYAFIRYLVPWYVRAALTLMIVVADDRQVRPVWRETRTRAITAWKIAGILVVIGVVTGIMGQISSTFLSQGTAAAVALGAVLYVVVLAAQVGTQTLFLMMAARQTQRGWKA